MTTPSTFSAPLTQSGSNRKYYRDTLSDGSRVIRVIGTSREENHAFVAMSRHFAAKGLPVPHILSVAADGMSYTQTDLGDTLLFDYIAHGRQSGNFSADEQDVLSRTMRALARIQTEGAEGMDWTVCYPVATFDRRTVSWDLNYWKYCFLKGTRIEFREDLLENDFDRLTAQLLSADELGFMYRDFQSRNVMLVEQHGKQMPYFIDFQGGRKGPLQYDVASFLWQAKANFSSALRAQLISDYLDEVAALYAKRNKTFDKDAFLRLLPHFVLFRTLQVLGAYGYRGYFERKQHFIESIPFALRNLRDLFAEHSDLRDAYPYIDAVAAQLPTESPAAHAAETPDDGALHVTIYSFSYKKGIPADTSGNGGGYVFDCRSTHNPGKYAQYKALTGLDEPVISFLEQDGEILTFLESVYRLADHHVARFIERGFTHLQIAFGCTGGQHRSVYCAEALAKHLHAKYDVRIHLIHREQHIDRIL